MNHLPMLNPIKYKIECIIMDFPIYLCTVETENYLMKKDLNFNESATEFEYDNWIILIQI